jgi:hypothetical protein
VSSSGSEPPVTRARSPAKAAPGSAVSSCETTRKNASFDEVAGMSDTHAVNMRTGAYMLAIERVAAMPVPASPLRRQVIAVTPRAYYFVPVNWAVGLDATSLPTEVSRGTFDPAVAAALDAPSVQGVRGWLRFPSYEVQPRRNGTSRVVIRDARFAVGNLPGFGVVALVELDAHHKVLAAPVQ